MQRATLKELPVVWRGARPPGSALQLSAQEESAALPRSAVNQIIRYTQNRCETLCTFKHLWSE